jgi:hypothetical protein
MEISRNSSRKGGIPEDENAEEDKGIKRWKKRAKLL